MKGFPAFGQIVFILIVAAVTGVLAGRVFFTDGLLPEAPFDSHGSPPIYITSDAKLLTQAESVQFKPLGWADLLPPAEQQLLNKYQPGPDRSMEDQFITAIEAATDDAYQNALHSTASVAALDGKAVTLNGFIVPLEADSERKVLRFFLVPYFGACLHFPPPAPNQMVYVVSDGGFTLADINSAYSVSGILGNAMYEDPLGTAAYVMDAVTISRYNGQPDDLRNHQH